MMKVNSDLKTQQLLSELLSQNEVKSDLYDLSSELHVVLHQTLTVDLKESADFEGTICDLRIKDCGEQEIHRLYSENGFKVKVYSEGKNEYIYEMPHQTVSECLVEIYRRCN